MTMDKRVGRCWPAAVLVGLSLAACGDPSSTGNDPAVADAAGPAPSAHAEARLSHGDAGATPRPTQNPLAPTQIPQFAQALPVLRVAGGTIDTVAGNQPITVHMCEFWAHVLPTGTLAAGAQPRTRVWGYIAGDHCPPNGPDAPAVDTYTGPVIVSARSHPPQFTRPPTTVTWVNELGTTETTQVLAWRLSTDQTVHWADPLGHERNACETTGGIPTFGSLCARNYAGPIPAVVHLHGGMVPPVIDGNPDAWFLSEAAPGYQSHGHAFHSLNNGDNGQPFHRATYAYPNTQEAAPVWFHDHTLGVTRLNVYAGLAGAYLITDPELSLPPGLTATGLAAPPGMTNTTVPLVIQSRSFDTNGQLLYPADRNGGTLWAPNPQHPYWAPEAFGDVIVVNGKAWPYHPVEPRRYRFLVINGADSQAFALSLVDRNVMPPAPGPPMWVISTDDGYLDRPVPVDPAAGQELRVLPGERYEVIIDFTGIAPGTQLVVHNSAAMPYPAGDAPTPGTQDTVMQFRVGPCTSGACASADPSYDPAHGAPLRTGSNAIVRLADPLAGTVAPGVGVAHRRLLTLNEVAHDEATVTTNPVTGEPDTEYPGGPLAVLLNNTLFTGESSRPYDDFTAFRVRGQRSMVSEVPREGDTELWEIVNLTADAHPIHTHLTPMQLVNRQDVDPAYQSVYESAFPAVMRNGPAGEFVPGFGPPLDYNTGNPNALGGNPDITPFLRGAPQPPLPQEAGWKDTIVMLPGQVTRVLVRFAPTDVPVSAAPERLAYPFDPSDPVGYVWHCHIISHEDNEMMRPMNIQPNPSVRSERPLRIRHDY